MTLSGDCFREARRYKDLFRSYCEQIADSYTLFEMEILQFFEYLCWTAV